MDAAKWITENGIQVLLLVLVALLMMIFIFGKRIMGRLRLTEAGLKIGVPPLVVEVKGDLPEEKNESKEDFRGPASRVVGSKPDSLPFKCC